MADLLTLNQIRHYIPGLTAYRFMIARKHIQKYGRGAPVPIARTPRLCRVDEKQLDHFLAFITSPHIVQDLPFGQRYLKLSNGRLLETPNVIRSMIPSRICAQYTQFCQESEVKPFSEKTMRRILSVCPATVRKSLQCLDYISADGSKAFDDLAEVVTKLENVCGSDWVSFCAKALKEGKQYIKSDFKVHVIESSDIADHCITHALSDPKESQYAAACDHDHETLCSSCEEIKIALNTIEAAVYSSGNLPADYSDDVKFTCQQSIQAIQAWKAHQLRSIQQEKPRISMINELAPHQILITQDWAMKFLPQKYRETQADWFGKRGISWHICVAVRKSPLGSLQHQAFVHVVKNSTQDSRALIAIMDHTLRTLKMENPEITTAFYRQDNAGCYHSVAMLTACQLMEETTGIKVSRVDFSDPQGGKGSCDRKAATIKAHVRRYINEGHDVQTASDLRDAISSSGGVRGVRVALVDGSALSSLDVGKLEGISTLNNFSFSESGLTCWKSYDVGQGKTIPWSQLQVPRTLEIVKCSSTFSDGSFTDIKSIAKTRKEAPEEEKEEDGDGDEESNGDEDHDQKLFTCPVDGCVCTYQKYKWLENHLEYGQCKLIPEKESFFDKAKILYSEKLTVGMSTQPVLETTPCEDIVSEQSLPQGWALKLSKRSVRFSDKQKTFLDEMFNRGKETGHKLDAATVAQEMRFAKDLAGNRRFQVDEFLSPSQVQSYFSRKASKDRHSSEEEVVEVAAEQEVDSLDVAAEEQVAYSQARCTIIDECQLTHPIVYESIDLCHLYATNKMDKLSISALKMACEYLDLDTSDIAARRKAPYIERIKSVLCTCSCMSAGH